MHRLSFMNTNEELMTENWIIPQDDYIINFDEWAPGNPLFITGSSGDGKSTLARKLGEEYNAIVVSSDVVLLRVFKTKEQWDALVQAFRMGHRDKHGIDFGNNIGMDYVMSNPEIPYGLKDPITKKTNDVAVAVEMIKFYKWFIDQTATNPRYNNKLYILEGCNICQLSPELMSTKPVIVVGGSRMRSLIRRVKRDMSENDSSILKSLFKYIKRYNTMNKVLDDEKDVFLRALQKISYDRR